MKIALYGKNFSPDFRDNICTMFDIFRQHGAELYIYENFSKFLIGEMNISPGDHKFFYDFNIRSEKIDFLFSLGGDGTFLETLNFVRDSGIPVIGINTGRLGFLANISRDEITVSINNLFSGNFSLEDRTLIRMNSNRGTLSDLSVALNEITVRAKDMGMISVNCELDGEFLNTYWADGLIISTPTGSTAYSMSVGGPIMLPESKDFIISPVSPHNLSVRPILVPDHKHIHLSVKSRDNQYLVALDSRSFAVDTNVEIFIDKAPFTLKLVKFRNNNFYHTLRNKLLWGLDKRN